MNRYNNLTAVTQVPIKSKQGKIYLCLCDCGNCKLVPISRLKSGNTKSCGCLYKKSYIENINKANSKKIKLFKESSYRYYFRQVKNGAKSRNLNFEINLDQFKNLVNASCIYCGEFSKTKINPLLKLDGTPRHKTIKNSEYAQELTIFVNGLDRINSKLGYTSDNIVTCCQDCNFMKQDYTVEEFLHKVKQIYEKSIKSNHLS